MTSPSPHDDATAVPLSSKPRRSAISIRSVALGMIGVAVICLLTPYNDYVLWNTFMVGNSLPLAAITLTFLLAALVNGPLSVWKPHRALSSGELGIVLAMMLVASALPASALMRYFPATLVYPLWMSGADADAAGLISRMDLPEWLFPSLSGDSPEQWAQDPVVTGYVGRWSQEGSPPYMAWVRPALTWGVYFVGFHGAMLCLLVIVRHQWYDNERLTFPLAQIQLALLETPEAGRWFGGVMARRSFWVVLVGINLLHGFNALHVYHPVYFPEIPLGFDFHDIMSEVPLSYAHFGVKQGTVFFTAVGVAYLLPGAISFSLWFFAVGFALWHIPVGMVTGEPTIPPREQHFGGMLAYAGIVAWIGRKHWWVVLKQAFRGEQPGEVRGRYLSYRAAFWMFVAFVGLMIGWMIAMGMTPMAALVITTLLLLGFFLLARIVAETGLLHPGNLLPFMKTFQYWSYYSGDQTISAQSFYRGSMLYMIHNDARESFGVFASHGLKLTDETIFNPRDNNLAKHEERSTGRKIIVLFAAVLVVGFVLSYASMLWVEYEYAYELHDQDPRAVNRHFSGNAVPSVMFSPSLQYEQQNYNYRFSPATHVIGGGVATVFLAVMRLQFAWWPFHPVGYLFMATGPMRQLWFSIMLGWLLRTVALRFGGAKGYTSLHPVMMGLIIGEAVASALWLGLGLLLSGSGMTFYPVRFLPG